MKSSLAFVLAVLGSVVTTLLAPTEPDHELSTQPTPSPTTAPDFARDGSCITCHAGIEEIHPGFSLSCVDCHGGDDTEQTKAAAHIQPRLALPTDERVLPATYDLPYQRFKNPANLRVAERVCGDCHGDLVAHLEKSLHGTTAGHLGDGFYEHGLAKTKRPTYSIFPVRDEDGEIPDHAVAATTQVPPFKSHASRNRIETHYSDLPRKACMQCHLYSEGRAIDGRVGLDGDYRGEGCAACHVTYADNGRSRSADKTIPKLEPGHPLKHEFTTKIPTQTCTRCHYGDASIGMHFRGLAQLVPGMPAGPEVEGTTDKLLNGAFYIEDPDMTPPDVHHERGMHCIDCHTLADTMGDGNIYPQMDHAVEIECTDCHGTFDAVSKLITSKGRRIANLEQRDEAFFLRSKVTGKLHRVTQVKHVIDKTHGDYNPRAAIAMNKSHARLECYACHSGWNVSFFGFHFDRNEQFTQLDLISGERTPGRVTTQEKVFATFNQLRLGFNHEGMIAPYMVGFSTIGSAHDKKGEAILRQALPKTHTGMSGVTLIPHQMHSVRRTPRNCVECHRTAVTYGMGSTNFRLTREFGYAVSGNAFHTVGLDAKAPQRTGEVASLSIDERPRSLAIRPEPAGANATHGYVACENGTLITLDLRNPVRPRVVGRKKKALVDPHRILVQGELMFVADGVGGVAIFDIARPQAPKPLATLATTDAHAVQLAWPWLVVADGAGGFVIANVATPTAPRVIADLDLNGEASAPNEAFDVAVLFHYSRTSMGRDSRLRRGAARHIAYLACGLDGVKVVDFTEPRKPQIIDGQGVRRSLAFNRGDVRGIAVNTAFDIGSAGGGIKSQEHDYLYAYSIEGSDDNRQRYLAMFDVSDPTNPQRVRRGRTRIYGGSGRLLMFRSYNAPFLKHFVVAAGSGGIGTMVDVSKPATGPEVAAVWDGIGGLRDLVFEEFAFDRLQDEGGTWLKDISHEDCRYLEPKEILRVLRAQIPREQLRTGRYGRIQWDPRRRRRNR